MVIKIRNAVLSDTNFKQGDSDNITATLTENGMSSSLTHADVRFHMKNDIETSDYDIHCNEVDFSIGRVSVPFGSNHMAVPGTFFGQFVASIPTGSDGYFGDSFFEEDFFGWGFEMSIQHTFPSSGYITMKIEKAI